MLVVEQCHVYVLIWEVFLELETMWRIASCREYKWKTEIAKSADVRPGLQAKYHCTYTAWW